MLLKRNITDYRTWIGLGQLLLFLGILGQQLGKGGIAAEWVGIQPLPSFWCGFIGGMSLTFIITSIFFNIRGLMYYRRHRQIE